ncbi:MAG: DUF4167 domain-containing protein [Pseudobdellovibrionaceae bacterium]
MRYGSAARRSRSNNSNNGGNRGGNNQQNQPRRTFTNKNKVFDSNGPDVRIRGTAYQIVEKYLTLAKDSSSAGDRVLAESYLQYAEHYQRVINSWEDEFAPDPFDPNYEEVYAQYAIRVAQREATRAAEVADVPQDDQAAVGEEDLGLPTSLMAPRMGERRTTEEMVDA